MMNKKDFDRIFNEACNNAEAKLTEPLSVDYRPSWQHIKIR